MTSVVAPVHVVEAGSIVELPVFLPEDPKQPYIDRGQPITKDDIRHLQLMDIGYLCVRRPSCTVNQIRARFESMHQAAEQALEGLASELYPNLRHNYDEYLTILSSIFASDQELAMAVSLLYRKDSYTLRHSLEVAVGVLAVGQSMGLSQKELVSLTKGAILHDIGKVYVPRRILKKPGPLTDEEFACVKSHPAIGTNILKSMDFNDPIVFSVVEEHHEKSNGCGYPKKISNQEVSLFGKITSVCDVHFALTSDRSYRPAWPVKKSMEFIDQQVGTSFCPEIVNQFKSVFYPQE